MTKAIRVHEAGGPEAMRLEDIELPPPGPGEAQIVQRAIGVNYIDVYYRTGAYPTAFPLHARARGRWRCGGRGRGRQSAEGRRSRRLCRAARRLCGGAQYSGRIIGAAAEIILL